MKLGNFNVAKFGTVGRLAAISQGSARLRIYGEYLKELVGSGAVWSEPVSARIP